jgi:hypothetical protein
MSDVATSRPREWLTGEQWFEMSFPSVFRVTNTILGNEVAEYETRESTPRVQVNAWTVASHIESVVKRIQDLAQLPENWDSYGGRTISAVSVFSALQFVGTTVGPSTPHPSVVPTSEGGLQLEWHRAGVDLEVEFLPSGARSVYFFDSASNESWERELGPATRDVDEVIAKLA